MNVCTVLASQQEGEYNKEKKPKNHTDLKILKRKKLLFMSADTIMTFTQPIRGPRTPPAADFS